MVLLAYQYDCKSDCRFGCFGKFWIYVKEDMLRFMVRHPVGIKVDERQFGVTAEVSEDADKDAQLFWKEDSIRLLFPRRGDNDVRITEAEYRPPGLRCDEFIVSALKSAFDTWADLYEIRMSEIRDYEFVYSP